MPTIVVPRLVQSRSASYSPGSVSLHTLQSVNARRAELLADYRSADAALALHDAMFPPALFQDDDGPTDETDMPTSDMSTKTY